MSVWTVLFGLAFFVTLIVAIGSSGNNDNLKDELKKTKGRLDDITGRYEQARKTIERIKRAEDLNENVVKAFTTLSEEISQDLEDLGMKEVDIQDPDEPFSELAPETREQLQIILGPIFQEGAAEATSQRWAGILKLAEIRYRLSLYKEQKLSSHAQLGISAKLHIENVQRLLKVARDQKVVIKAMGFDHLDIDSDGYGKALIQTAMYNLYVETLEVLGLHDPRLMEGVKELLPQTSSSDEAPKITKAEKVESEEFDEEFVEGDFSENGKGRLKKTKEN